MSAIQMTCDHCSARFVAGMVGMTPWPPHVCPDGTKDAPASFGWDLVYSHPERHPVDCEAA